MSRTLRRDGGRRRGALEAAIETFIDGWNDRCHPFTWTKTADEIGGAPDLPDCGSL